MQMKILSFYNHIYNAQHYRYNQQIPIRHRTKHHQAIYYPQLQHCICRRHQQMWKFQFIGQQLIQMFTVRQCNIFWRTYDGQEIDLLELNNGQLQALECKWKDTKAKIPVAFAKAYPDANFSVVNKNNYLEWITQTTS